ncbi:CDP-alcohol phosphatidyltransferase family protein (plasmid) [Sinorhizobium garamanticum]|uniref:CDP-alcohol phosphatidyltransferase family protein n=1 Tax=Sinorhizobium garamanticum TaxID=680247 RepID=A0ABY8DLB5_9HYPH|nr:CDP-alcohol phosphatidyltransferase family protein [Sinorhizobium garamanticum]WEX91674.1 CDP-alcohol phosphatidyltransferase family protein [Sinorhizobium garamanticum]
MIRYLYDPANAITALGLVLSTTAIYLALVGCYEIGICFALWALLADDLDGMIAKSLPNRSAVTAQIGAAFDGFADLVYAAVFPAVVILSFNAFSALAFLAAVCLMLSAALRLSYFSVFRLDVDGYGRGLPLNNDLFVLAILFAANRYLVIGRLGGIVIGAAFLLSILHLSSFKFPGTGTALRLANLTLSTAGSIALLAGEFAP